MQHLRIRLSMQHAYLIVVVMLTVLMYWIHQPIPQLNRYPVAVVEQQYGSSSVLKVPQLALINAKEIHIHSATVTTQGELFISTPTLLINKHSDSYAVLTYKDLPIGQYNVVVHVEYMLNPMKTGKQQFTLATISVKQGIRNEDHKPAVEDLCPRHNQRFRGSNCISEQNAGYVLDKHFQSFAVFFNTSIL